MPQPKQSEGEGGHSNAKCNKRSERSTKHFIDENEARIDSIFCLSSSVFLLSFAFPKTKKIFPVEMFWKSLLEISCSRFSDEKKVPRSIEAEQSSGEARRGEARRGGWIIGLTRIG